MNFGFATFEKLREIFEGIRKGAWFLVPITAFIAWVQWLLLDWLPARAIAVMENLASRLPQIDIDVAAVGLQWSRVNQWVPLNEIVVWGGLYLSLALLIVVIKLLKRFIFIS